VQELKIPIPLGARILFRFFTLAFVLGAARLLWQISLPHGALGAVLDSILVAIGLFCAAVFWEAAQPI